MGDRASCPGARCRPALTLTLTLTQVSSDNMGPGRAAGGGAAYHAAGTFNSGILLFRATPAGKRFVAAWHDYTCCAKRGTRYWGKTSDQQVFNAMVRKERQWPGVHGRRGEWLMGGLHPEWDGRVTLGALPLNLFANGHGYFVQSAHVSMQVATSSLLSSSPSLLTALLTVSHPVILYEPL